LRLAVARQSGADFFRQSCLFKRLPSGKFPRRSSPGSTPVMRPTPSRLPPPAPPRLQINIWNDVQRRGGDKLPRIGPIEITREFESASKFFASFSKFFLGGFAEFQRVAAEKIWKTRIL
jgi:hypothetical protein